MTPLQVRFMTWNVHGCVGRDGVCDPDRVASVLEAAQPDISALQEIDNRTTSAARDPFSYFGSIFGWTTVAARTLTARDGHYGHIVLSRWPVQSLGEIDLSVRRREPRKAIVGAIAAPTGRIVGGACVIGSRGGSASAEYRTRRRARPRPHRQSAQHSAAWAPARR